MYFLKKFLGFIRNNIKLGGEGGEGGGSTDENFP